MNHPSVLEAAAVLPSPVSPLWEHELCEMVSGVPACSEEERLEIECSRDPAASNQERRRATALLWVCELMCLIEETELRVGGQKLEPSSSVPLYFDEDDWKALARIASRQFADLLKAAGVPSDESRKLLAELRSRAEEWTAEPREGLDSWEPVKTPRANFYRYALSFVQDHIVGLGDESIDELLGPEEPPHIGDGNNPRRYERLEDGTIAEVPITPFAFKMFARALQYFPWGYVDLVLQHGRYNLEDLLHDLANHQLWEIETLLERVEERVHLGLAMKRALRVDDDDPAPASVGALSWQYAEAGGALTGWFRFQLEGMWFSDDDVDQAHANLLGRLEHFMAMIEEIASLQVGRAGCLAEYATKVPDRLIAEYQIPEHLDLNEAMFWAHEQLVHLHFLNPRLVSLPPEVDDKPEDGRAADNVDAEHNED